MSIKRIIIFIIIFNIYIVASLNNYLSVQIILYDDCIISLQTNSLFISVTPAEVQNCYLGQFKNGYNSGDYILRNYIYTFNEKLEFTFGDSDHTEGWMVTNIFFNEYLIEVKDRVFWKCRDCNNWGNNYVTYDQSFEYDNVNYNYRATVDPYNKIFFYYIPADSSKDKLYTYHFYFVISELNDLYKGGQRGAFTVNNTFYSFCSQRIFEFTCFTKRIRVN